MRKYLCQKYFLQMKYFGKYFIFGKYFERFWYTYKSKAYIIRNNKDVIRGASVAIKDTIP